jgi:type VI protein secretion system component VasK
MWKQKNGVKIRIKDMENSHIINAMNILKRVAQAKRNRDESEYLSGGYPQGEMAQDAFESEFDNFLENVTYTDYLPAIYNDLEDEARRRKLI